MNWPEFCSCGMGSRLDSPSHRASSGAPRVTRRPERPPKVIKMTKMDYLRKTLTEVSRIDKQAPFLG